MSVTSLLTSDSLAVKLWGVKGYIDIIKGTAFGRMMDRGTISRADELDRAKAGDTITVDFTGILTGTGIGEGGTLAGNEESLNNQAFSMSYGLFRHAVASPNADTIEQQRTNIPFEKRGRALLPTFHASRLDASVFNQLAGLNSTTITVDGTTYAGTNRTFVQGLNTINVPSPNRVVWAGGNTADEQLGSTNTMSLDLIDAAEEKLASTYPSAGTLEGEEFDLYISFEQLTDLKRDTTSKIQWYQMNLAAMTGGQIKDNLLHTASPFSKQPVGKYGRVNIIPSFRVAFGQNSSTSAAIPTVRRSVMVGRNALMFGSPFGGTLDDIAMDGDIASVKVPLKFFTQLKDYDYVKGIEGRMIYGVKKTQFQGEDFGSIVISTYAAAHTS